MKRRIFVSLVLCFAILIASVSVFALDGENEADVIEIPYSTEKVSGVTVYGYGSLNYMTEAEAEAAGVPEGYTGDVLLIVGASAGSMGVTLISPETEMKVNDIESITFRIWCPEGTKEFRITDNAGKDWIVRVKPEKTEDWIEVTVTNDGQNIYSGKSFNNFADANGYFKAVNMGVRFNDGVNALNKSFYIDSVTFKMREADTKAPVITYNGETEINTTAGKAFIIDATAYDEYDKANITPEYIYSEGAVDENGLLLEGKHTCTVRFTDAAGNSSEIVIGLTIDPRDVTAPVLDWAPDKIFAEAGMMPRLTLTATDDRDGEIEAVASWSNGAIIWGRLVVGEHTLTVTATDSSGNKTEKTITVVVINP